MRNLTKKALQFSWSLSLFGVQQLMNLLTPGKAARSFGNASRAMECELGGALHSAFQVGDGLQQGLVDLTLGGPAGASPRPNPAPAPPADSDPAPGPPPAPAQGAAG